MRAAIYHNVQRACRECGGPVAGLGKGQYIHRGGDRDHEPEATFRAGYDGYEPGHAMSRVLEAEVPDGLDPRETAQLLYDAGNLDAGELAEKNGIDLPAVARAYAERELRALSVGDVIVIGEVPLAVAGMGFTPVGGGLFRAVPCREPGSVSLPQCSYCRVTGDASTLEPFNAAGNLACRDARACSSRMAAAERGTP